MGRALEVLGGKVTNPGATLTALTPSAGDSFSVRSADMSAGVFLENAWGQGATAGVLRIRSPRMHDNVQGIRLGVSAANPVPLFPEEVRERLYPQDAITVELSGGGAEVDVATLLVHYADLPGIASQLATWEEIAPRIQHYLTVESQLTSGATAGDWGGTENLTGDFNLLKANTWYAILGYISSVSICTVGYRGPDIGNLRIGGPGTINRVETRNWFIRLSKILGQGAIPIFNSANAGSTNIDLLATQTSTAVVVQTILAELSS